MFEKIENSVSFRVHNFGNELSTIEQTNIFKYKQRINKDQNGNIQGWGIGLTLVKGIIEAHGGTIAVKSERGKGTTFTVTIPLDARLFHITENSISPSFTEELTLQ